MKRTHKFKALGDVAAVIAASTDIRSASLTLGVSWSTVSRWIKSGKVRHPNGTQYALAPSPLRQCKNCGRSFTAGKQGQRLCSMACRQPQKQYVITCRHCGRMFSSVNKHSVFCSNTCRVLAGRRPDDICRHCHAVFRRKPNANKGFYCSRECSFAAKGQRRQLNEAKLLIEKRLAAQIRESHPCREPNCDHSCSGSKKFCDQCLLARNKAGNERRAMQALDVRRIETGIPDLAKGQKVKRPAKRFVRFCPNCGKQFHSSSNHTRTCSKRCRRRIRKLAFLLAPRGASEAHIDKAARLIHEMKSAFREINDYYSKTHDGRGNTNGHDTVHAE